MSTHTDILFVDYIDTMCILMFVNKNVNVKKETCCELFVMGCTLTISMNLSKLLYMKLAPF